MEKSNKKKIIGLIGIVLVLCLVVFGNKFHEAKKWKPADEVVTQFLDGYKKQDTTINELLMDNAFMSEIEYGEYSDIFSENLNYKIKGHKMNDDIKIVVVEIKNVDFEKTFDKCLNNKNLKNEKAIIDYFKKNTSTKSYTCEVTVVDMEGGYKIILDGYLTNALTGGMGEYLDSLMVKE